MKTIFLPLLLVALFTSINQSSHAADDDSRLWVATSNGKTVKWIGRFDSAHEERVTFWKTGNCDNAGNFSAGLQPVKVSCDFMSLRAEDQRFIQDILEKRRVADQPQKRSAPAQSKPQDPFDPDKYLAQKESLPEGLTPINANPAQLPEGYTLDKPTETAAIPQGGIMDFDNPQKSSPLVDPFAGIATEVPPAGYTLDPPPQLTPAQIKARDFMADIESQRKTLVKKAYILRIAPQFNRWPKDYSSEESEYLSGEMGMIKAFRYERKCKKYISELETLIDNAVKNIQPLPD